MAAVEITISGVLYDKYNRTQQNVVLIGEASITGLGVGGGPVYPPAGGGSPPGIWGPPGPWPTPPIAFPPGWVGGQPPGGGGGGGQPPHPAFPIWGGPGTGFPDKPGYPPVVGGGPIIPPDKPPEPVQPPIEWKAVWHPTEGWVVVGIPNVPHPTPSSGGAA